VGRLLSVGWEQRECLSVERGEGTKMSLVECRERVGGPLSSEYDNRGVGEPELEVSVARADLSGRSEAASVERLHGVGHRKILEQRQLGVDPEAGQHQVVGLGRRERGDDQNWASKWQRNL
jgi:hypothetical protein